MAGECSFAFATQDFRSVRAPIYWTMTLVARAAVLVLILDDIPIEFFRAFRTNLDDFT